MGGVLSEEGEGRAGVDGCVCPGIVMVQPVRGEVAETVSDCEGEGVWDLHVD